MNWFLIGLIPPAVWSITNHIDKYLVSKYFKGGGVGALMIFSSVIGTVLLPFIYIFNPGVFHLSFMGAILIALNGMLYLVATLPYFYALSKDETSIAVPLFQLIPVFSYILAYLVLGETLEKMQLLGGLLIVLGAIAITLELKEGEKIKFKEDVFLLMVLSSVIFSLNFLFFKVFSLRESFWVTSFWEYIGFSVFGALLLIFVKPYRKEFISVIRENKIPVLGLNGFNEVINIVGKITFNFASLLTPITLMWIVNGFQPLFVFAYGVILTLFFPHIAQEDITKRHLAQKSIAIVVMLVGTYLLNI